MSEETPLKEVQLLLTTHYEKLEKIQDAWTLPPLWRVELLKHELSIKAYKLEIWNKNFSYESIKPGMILIILLSWLFSF